jgi:1-phosphofructokinase family hexose kinase
LNNRDGARDTRRFLAVCLNPTMQKTLLLDSFRINEVNRVVEQRLDASGKGVNVARVLGELGEAAVHLTHLGGDRRAQFEQLCRADRVSLEVIGCTTPIRTCTTVVDRGHHTTTEIVEPTFPVDQETATAVFERYRELVPAVTTVILSGTTAPGYAPDLFARMTREARAAGAYVIADFRGINLRKALENEEGFRPSLIKTNLKEFAETFFGGNLVMSEHADDPETLQSAREHMRRLRDLGVTVVISRGGNATLALDAEGELATFQPLPLTPVNTIGCGDAFTAGLAAELARGSSLADSIEQGHAAAAMNAANVKPGSIRPL